jgi:TRAP-type C4-dicarboxylate transport system substrate-binding protein
MKKFALLAAVIPMVFLCQTPAQSAPASDFKPVELKVATNYGPTHRALTLIQYWVDRVAKVTDGKVTATIYPGETLVKQNEQYPALRDGIVDVVAQDPAYNPEAFPLIGGFALPGIRMDNSVVATHTANDYYKSGFDELKPIKFLFAIGLGPSGLESNKRITTLDDFKGMQIRATGFAMTPVKQLGAAPVGLTASEIYEALLKGTVDASLMPFDGLINWNLAEVCKYAISIPVITNTSHYVVMNKETWEKFPADIQKAIEGVNAECVEKAATLWDGMGKEGLDFAQKKGVEIYTVSDAEIAKMVTALEPIQENWVKEQEGKGVPGRKALDILKQLAAKYNAQYGNK